MRQPTPTPARITHGSIPPLSFFFPDKKNLPPCPTARVPCRCRSQPRHRTRGNGPRQVERSHARRPSPCGAATPSSGTHATPPLRPPAGAASAAASPCGLLGSAGRANPLPSAHVSGQAFLLRTHQTNHIMSLVSGACGVGVRRRWGAEEEGSRGWAAPSLGSLYNTATGGGDVWINERLPRPPPDRRGRLRLCLPRQGAPGHQLASDAAIARRDTAHVSGHPPPRELLIWCAGVCPWRKIGFARGFIVRKFPIT
jgi:hypothetical protein